jgi:uncharacterized protein YhbP (UPF0306 family)
MSNDKKLRGLIVEYLSGAKMLQVATSKNDQPWACTVYFAYDENLNLYWISKSDRRHSTEIEENSKVAGTIVLPHKPGDKVRGIQLQGEAKKLNGKSASEGLNIFANRFGMSKEKIDVILNESDGHFCYKIKPNYFVLYDEVNYPKNPRQELPLQ